MRQALHAFLRRDGGRVHVCQALAVELGAEPVETGGPSRRLAWAHIIAAWLSAPLLLWSALRFPGHGLPTALFAAVLATVVPVLVVVNWQETEYVWTGAYIIEKGGLFQAAPSAHPVSEFVGVEVHVGPLSRILGLAELRMMRQDGTVLRLGGLELEVAGSFYVQAQTLLEQTAPQGPRDPSLG